MVRTATSTVASFALIAAASTLTWWGVAAILILSALFIDLLRRVSRIDTRMTDINDRLDTQHATITGLKALVEGEGD